MICFLPLQQSNGVYTVGDFMTKRGNLHVVKPSTSVDEGTLLPSPLNASSNSKICLLVLLSAQHSSCLYSTGYLVSLLLTATGSWLVKLAFHFYKCIVFFTQVTEHAYAQKQRKVSFPEKKQKMHVDHMCTICFLRWYD
jgi:hypothetical protein